MVMRLLKGEPTGIEENKVEFLTESSENRDYYIFLLIMLE